MFEILKSDIIRDCVDKFFVQENICHSSISIHLVVKQQASREMSKFKTRQICLKSK